MNQPRGRTPPYLYQVRFPQEMADEIKVLAEQEDRSFHWMVLRLLRVALRQEGPVVVPDEYMGSGLAPVVVPDNYRGPG